MFLTLITDLKELGKEMKDREWHLAKAASPIVVTESGSVMDVSEEHAAKAADPIVVSESGSVMDVSEEHSAKPFFGTVVGVATT